MDNQQNKSGEALERSALTRVTAGVEKVQRYLGLLVAFALLALATYPVVDEPRGLNNYLKRTVVGAKVMQTSQGRWVAAVGRHAVACAEFVRESSPESASVHGVKYLNLGTECEPMQMFSSVRFRDAGLEKLLEAKPDFWEQLDRYIELRQQTPLARGQLIGINTPWTPELVDAGRPLVVAMLDEYQRSLDWLPMAHVLGGILVVLLAGCCIVLRQEVGGLLLLPLYVLIGVGRGVGKVASEVHKRI